MRNALNLLLVCIVVPYALEGTVLGPSDKRVRAFLGGILKGRKLLLGHVHGVEVCAKRPGAVALHESLVVHAVPRAVVHVCELLCRRVLKVVKSGFGAEILLPVNGIGLVCRKLVEVQDLLAIIGDAAEIRCGNGYHRIVLQKTRGLGTPLAARRCGKHGRNRRERYNELSHKVGLKFYV